MPKLKIRRQYSKEQFLAGAMAQIAVAHYAEAKEIAAINQRAVSGRRVEL